MTVPTPLPLLLGANVDPTWSDPLRAVLRARRIEEAGLDLITLQDRPSFYDPWALTNWILASTDRLLVLPTVFNLPLRRRAVVARSAATAFLLSDGRVQLGLGARTGEVLDTLSNGIDVVHAMWRGERDEREGVTGGLGIWLDVLDPRALRLLGAKADGWIASSSYFGPAELPRGNGLIKAGAEEVGRDPAELTRMRKVYNIAGLIGAEAVDPFHGSVRQWADALVTLVREDAMNAFVYWPEDDHDRQTDIFAGEVAPLVREAVSGGGGAAS
ncbi:LLM class flavin-dependent oxidoreductase [Streptomyces spiramyceticus]|uniref:LLM class flavin-dependent oxidoreductase n=1 Tax=Streptomyces spiramyceticus TaxID=299717 RepID=UPI00237BCB80|nr:LLM class flavin-dependent oxidoreductase [Streptomyces spiramyceticus]